MFFYWDNAQQHYAQTVFLQDGLRSGVIPQWWPDAGLGFPTTAEGQAAHYHPVRVIMATLFSTPAALMWELALYFAIAGLATFGFLRELRLHRLACFLGAASHMFTSFAIVYVRNLALHRSFCLLPLAMLCAERFVQRRSARSIAGMALVSGVQFLAGHPSFAVVTAIATTVYVALRIGLQIGRPSFSIAAFARAFVAPLGAWAGAIALGMAVAAVQVIPTVLHTEQSQRQGGLSFEAAVEAVTATPRGLGQLVFPYAYTQGDFLPEPAAWGSFNPVPTAGMYCGLVCVAFAPAAVWWRRRRPDAALTLAASLAIALGFSLGPRAPFFPLLWSLPGMNGLRFPSRYLLWAAFCLCCLAAIGAHRLLGVGRIRMGRIGKLAPLLLVGVGLALFAAAIAWQLPAGRGGVAVSLAGFAGVLLLGSLIVSTTGRLQRSLLFVAGGLAIGDLLLFRALGGYAPTVPIADALTPPPAVGVLKHDVEPFRVMSLFPTEDGAFFTSELRDYLQADLCTIWGIDSADVFLSLFLKRNYAVRLSIVQEILQRPDSARKLASFLGAMNVKYLIAPSGIELAGWQREAELSRTTIWKNPAALPRAFLVGNVVPQQFELREDWRRLSDDRLIRYREAVADWSSRRVDAQILDHVMASQIDYRTTAEVVAADAIVVEGIDPEATLETLPAGPDEMRFAVSSSKPAFLVISSSSYPGWSATVNGQPADLVQTNWVMSGLAVPAGKSAVVLRYTTPGFRAGQATSLAALLATGGILLWPLRRRAAPAVS